MVSVNNNTSTQANSLLGAQSRIVDYNSTTLLAAAETGATATAGTVKVRIRPSAMTGTVTSLANAFIAIFCHHDGLPNGAPANPIGPDQEATTGNYITITGIKIEKVDALP